MAAGVAGLTAVVLVSIVIGWGWLPLALLAVILLAPPLFALVLFRGLLFSKELKSDDAARYIADQFNREDSTIEPARKSAREAELSRRASQRAKALMPTGLRRYLYGMSETPYSALFDYNDQPVFKHFLRVDVAGDEVTFSCFGVSAEQRPTTLEDKFSWDPIRGWTISRAVLTQCSQPGGPRGDVAFYLRADGASFLVFDGLGVPKGAVRVALREDRDSEWQDGGTIDWNGARAERLVSIPVPPRGWFEQIRLTPIGSPTDAEVLIGTFL
jgi:hypothetical protein